MSNILVGFGSDSDLSFWIPLWTLALNVLLDLWRSCRKAVSNRGLRRKQSLHVAASPSAPVTPHGLPPKAQCAVGQDRHGANGGHGSWIEQPGRGHRISRSCCISSSIKQLKMVSMVHSKQSTCSEASQTSVVFLLIDWCSFHDTVIDGFQFCFLLQLLLWSRWNHQSQVVRAQKDQQKRSAERTHIVNVAGRWAQPYPYATTISIVFVCFCQKCKLKNTKGRMWGLLLPWSCSYVTIISSCRIFFSGHTITWKKSFSGHHALPISMQDIDWTPSIWASMMFLKSWGTWMIWG